MAMQGRSDSPIHGNLEPPSTEQLAHSWYQHLTSSRESSGLRLPRVDTSASRLDLVSEHKPATDVIETLRSEVAALRQELRAHRAPEPPRVLYAPPIKLKDIVATVPMFDGHSLPVLQFTRACKRALAMLPVPTPPDTELNLVRMLKTRLTGHAYLAVEDDPCSTVEELSDALKAVFCPHRGVNFYRGELHHLYKDPAEHVLEYISRTKELRQTILDGECKIRDRHFDSSQRICLDTEVRESFIDGLPPELRVPLRVERCNSLQETYQALIRVHHFADRDADRRQAVTVNQLRPVRTSTQTKAVQPEITCNYCKKPGHIKFNCELRRINNKRNLAKTAGNSLGVLSSPSAGQAALTEQRSAITSFLDIQTPGPSNR